MVSPLKQQRDALLKAKQTKPAVAHDATASLDSLHLRLIEFEQDKKALKSFVQIAQKVNHKREVLIPKYKPVAEAYLEAGERYQNPIFQDLIVWLFDIEELETAIAWCLKAIEHDLPTPENFKRNWPTVCADFVLEWATKQQEHGRSVEPYFSQVFKLIDGEWELNEKVEAKWYKFAGYCLLLNEKGAPQPSQVGDKEQLEASMALLLKAHEKNPKIGVKTQIDKIQMRINALDEGKNL
ncbi:phage terminase small subunit [Vibrio sp. V08_P9A1T1]|uniref:phage terminase small subunit n=1 Tax=Vibrio sp. V08_P9A1T1 TaxID=1938663 RepID=UPI000B8E301C|nr:terminase endonuclease subunit [Vibrio sp. V08_P9A1T1]OXX22056.1 terminase [Vibrio sp. V08_P9A1T1]